MVGQALDYCFNELDQSFNRGRDAFILLVTDGQSEDQWRKTPNARVVAAGIDSAVNMDLLGRIARASGGTSLAIYPGEDYHRAANTLVGMLSGPVLEEIKVFSGGQELADVVGRTSLYQNMPATLSIRGQQLPPMLELQGKNSQGGVESFTLDTGTAREFEFAHQLWAREKLRGDLKPEEQLALSLRYGVLCAQTSFVAVSFKDVPGQQPERVEIPVALPHTWDYDAVFGPPSALMAMASPAAASPALRISAAQFGLPQRFVSQPASQSTSVVDELEELVEQLENYQLEHSEARSRWTGIRDALERADLTKWSELERTKCLYLLLMGQSFGLDVAKTLIQSFLQEPTSSEALDWWKKAQAYLGVSPSE